MYRTPIEFNSKRKPSRALIMRTLAEYISKGMYQFEITWGENWMEVEKQRINGRWCGYGWIKDISGDDIAQELNEMQKEAVDQFYDFLKDHVQISFVK